MNVAKHYLVLAFRFWKRCFTKNLLFVLRRGINAINCLGIRFTVLIAKKIDLWLVLVVVLEKQVVCFVADVVRNFGKLMEI